MKKEYLFAPGPTPVPSEVLLEMARPIFHHRTGRFMKLLGKVIEDLKRLFLTRNDVLVITGSGTAAMEAALINTVAPGEKALIVRGGKFGERWGELAEAFGVVPVYIDVEWGKAVEPAQIESALKKDPAIAAVFTTQCETSTAVKTDIRAIGPIVAKTNAILVVDGISAVPSMEMRTDEWNVDMLVVGSQKALMLPPGLAFLSVSEKAWKKVEKCGRGYYLNLKKYRKAMAQTDTPYTPAVGLVAAMARSAEMLLDYGLENLWRETSRMAEACREAAIAMGLKVYAGSPADSVTAIELPAGVDGSKVTKLLQETHGITVAGGQEKLKGRIVRIAHMGYVDKFDMLAALAALEAVLVSMGVKLNRGAGIARAWEILSRAD